MDSTDRRKFLVGLFVIVTIVGFFYSPWEEGSEIVFKNLMEADESAQNILMKLFLYGIMDWVELLTYCMYGIGMVTEDIPNDWGLLGFAVPMVCVIIFLIFQFIIAYIEEEYIDDYDEFWGKLIDSYLMGSIISYIFCVISHFASNYLVRHIIWWVYEKHQLLAAILSYLFPILGMWMILSLIPTIIGYIFAISIPILLLLLLTAIPVIGVIFNSILGLIIFLIMEIIMIFYLWGKYLSGYALQATLWIALLPLKFLEDKFT